MNSGIVIRERNAIATDDNADHYIPITNIMHMMLSVLPPNAKIADDTKDAMEACAYEFITYITHQANGKCHQESRRKVTPEDVLAAMESMGMHNYVEPLYRYLAKHRRRNMEQGGSSNAPTVNQREDGELAAALTATPLPILQYKPGGFCDLLLNPNRNPFDEEDF